MEFKMSEEVIKDASSATEKIVSDDTQVKKDQVDYASFNKVLGQYKKAKSVNEELQSELENYKKAEQEIKEKKLADQGEYNKLLELKEQKLKELTDQLENAQAEKQTASETLINAQKLGAVYEKLPGKLKNNKFMQFIDIDSVVRNPETGEIDAESASVVANQFMEEFDYAVDTSHVGRIRGTASSTTTPLHKSFKELPLKDMRKNVAEAVRQRLTSKG